MDQMEHHFADILAGADAPVLEDGCRHGPEFPQRILPEAFQHLGTTHVPVLDRLVATQFLEGKIKHLPKEKVGVVIETPVLLADGANGFFKSDLLHGRDRHYFHPNEPIRQVKAVPE